ncbi:uncharacterized protein LOC114943728 [Nylanderia fulva]|uniref:uncharacterized protein LOC114943728 n=1 Tax=Nylanderia fulva TaxID=613905 RepID=UPI0010FB9734|nr:uncharacterized protein LOC114943728 [Nylanderia fulva]
MDVYFKPFIKEITQLHEEGIMCPILEKGNVNIKVHTLIAILDSTARPKIQEFNQFNGEGGCPFCLNLGETMEKGRGYIRIYRPFIGTLRTSQQVLIDAENAINQNESVNGVKGFSPLSIVPIFDVVRSYVPDYMHANLLGTIRTFCEIWFNSTYHNRPWYIGNKRNQVNQRLLSIKPPTEIRRTPSSIEKRALWKATDWRNFGMYYSLVVLRGILPTKYYEHWFLLVFTLRLLLKENVTKTDIDEAKLSIHKFVELTETLYGPEFLLFNLHLHLHMPRCVKDWGALWDSSAFMYEHGNGILVQLFHGTGSVISQIFKRYELTNFLQKTGPTVFSANTFTPAIDLFGQLVGEEYFVQNAIRENEDLVLFGSSNEFVLTQETSLLIENLLGYNFINQNNKIQVSSFKRFIWKHTMFHSTSYARLTKRLNSIVKLSNEKILQIDHLLRIRINEEKYFVLIGQQLILNTGVIVANYSPLKISSSKFLNVVKISNGRVFCCMVNDIYEKCLCMNINGITYVSTLINKSEKD